MITHKILFFVLLFFADKLLEAVAKGWEPGYYQALHELWNIAGEPQK